MATIYVIIYGYKLTENSSEREFANWNLLSTLIEYLYIC